MMIRRAIIPHSLLLMACLFLAGGPPAAGQELASHGYRVKPSEVAVPDGVALGQYRRIIRPFENWTLICDEDLKARKKVCNITQVIVDQSGNNVFSWSLAATERGKPYFLLRVPPAMKSDEKIALNFAGRRNPIEVTLQGCNTTVCVGIVPVGPILRDQIGKAGSLQISFPTVSGETMTVTTPLKGLDKAIAAIN